MELENSSAEGVKRGLAKFGTPLKNVQPPPADESLGNASPKPADGKCELCDRKPSKLEYREGWGGQNNKGWVCADGKGCDEKGDDD